MAPLSTDYAAGAGTLRPFFSGRPGDLFTRPFEAPVWDRVLAEQINVRQEELGASGRVRGNELAVVTGQQPGLFLGPLYAAYKAVTAILAARALRERCGRDAVPVFWLAGDDHDLEECATVHLLTKRHEPLELRYRPDAPAGAPMNKLPLDASIPMLIDAASGSALGSEKSHEVNFALQKAARDSSSLSEWCARSLAWLFRETPLIIFEPSLPRARELAAPALRREIAEPLETSRLVNEQGAALEERGYQQQVSKSRDECSFFAERAGRRCKVIYRDGRFRLPEARQSIKTYVMLDKLDSTPEEFTPNVALRPVIQQMLLPVAAYVAGPGETAYWAQLGPVFERHGLEMPIVYPRAQAVVTREKERQLLSELSLTLGGVNASEEELVDHALKQVARNPARDVLERGRKPIESAMESLMRDMGCLDERGEQMAEALRRHAGRQLARMERAMRWADEAQVEAARRQAVRLRNVLAPWRKPQERVYTPYSFLFQWGREFIGRLLEDIDIYSFDVNEVKL